MLPDRRGNIRVDSLRDIVRDPRHRAAVPDPRCGQNSSHQRPRSDKVQRRVIVVTAESVYTQCPKAPFVPDCGTRVCMLTKAACRAAAQS